MLEGAVLLLGDQLPAEEKNELLAELTAPLLYSPTANIIQSQASGGSQGNNNDSQMNAFR